MFVGDRTTASISLAGAAAVACMFQESHGQTSPNYLCLLYAAVTRSFFRAETIKKWKDHLDIIVHPCTAIITLCTSGFVDDVFALDLKRLIAKSTYQKAAAWLKYVVEIVFSLLNRFRAK